MGPEETDIRVWLVDRARVASKELAFPVRPSVRSLNESIDWETCDFGFFERVGGE